MHRSIEHLGVRIGDEKAHWTEREAKARGAWQHIRRLTRLPPRAKRQVVAGQLLPLLLYGAELHQHPTESMRRLVREWQRWIVGAWRGSNAQKVSEICGIPDIDVMVQNKRIRWAASVYGRALPQLRTIAEPILRGAIDPEIQLRWMGGSSIPETLIEETEFCKEKDQSYSDGSRAEGANGDMVTAAATQTRDLYLGRYATVMDAEEAGVMMSWEDGKDHTALDSKGALTRITSLSLARARSWIEEAIQTMAAGRHKKLSWVRGHSGVRGNEEADARARRAGWMGSAMQQPEIAIPAGIRHHHPIMSKTAQMKWDREAVRGLTYMHTDKGPLKHWLAFIGRADDEACACGVTQNAAHLLHCRLIGDGLGRTAEDIWNDPDWCREVARALRR